MYFEDRIPARCCIAPEIPTAMYKLGLTVFPVCPTCIECGISSQVSTAALDAPTAAPNLSAISSRWLKFAGEPIPLPPEMMMFASETSSLCDARCTISLIAVDTFPVVSMTCISQLPLLSDGANIFALTLITESPLIDTFWIALPE